MSLYDVIYVFTIFIRERILLVGLHVLQLVLLKVGDLLHRRLVGELNLQN